MDITKEIVVIPNFIDLLRFTKQSKEHFKKAICPNNEKLIVHTSNFRKVKRVEDAIRIFDKVRREVPAKLLLVGDGPERIKAENLCRELGTCDDIRFLGKMEQIDRKIRLSCQRANLTGSDCNCLITGQTITETREKRRYQLIMRILSCQRS